MASVPLPSQPCADTHGCGCGIDRSSESSSVVPHAHTYIYLYIYNRAFVAPLGRCLSSLKAENCTRVYLHDPTRYRIPLVGLFIQIVRQLAITQYEESEPRESDIVRITEKGSPHQQQQQQQKQQHNHTSPQSTCPYSACENKWFYNTECKNYSKSRYEHKTAYQTTSVFCRWRCVRVVSVAVSPAGCLPYNHSQPSAPPMIMQPCGVLIKARSPPYLFG